MCTTCTTCGIPLPRRQYMRHMHVWTILSAKNDMQSGYMLVYCMLKTVMPSKNEYKSTVGTSTREVIFFVMKVGIMYSKLKVGSLEEWLRGGMTIDEWKTGSVERELEGML